MRVQELRDTQSLNGACPPRRLRVIIAAYHAMFRQGLRSLLAPEGLEVVAEVGQTSSLKAAVATNPCDVLLLDLQMEQWSMGQISKLSRKTAVIVLSSDESIEIGLMAVRSGARAVVQKHFGVDILMTAIRTVADGLVWVPPAMHAALIEKDNPAAKQLTRRESEIVRKVAMGMRNVEVAARLSLTESAVKAQLNRIFRRLEIRDRIQLTRYAIRTGLVTMTVQTR